MKSPAVPSARPPRYAVAENHAVTVRIESKDSDALETMPGNLIDLSPGGAKVMLGAPLRFQQAIALRLDCAELELHVSLAARVCWIRASGDQWCLGCSFEPALPHADVDRLLAHGVLDRRRDDREPIDRPALATWELNPQLTPVTVIDLSRGGFCVRSAQPAEPTSRLRLQVTNQQGAAVAVTATVQWRMECAEGFLMGCSLPNVENYTALRAALLSEPLPVVRPRKRRLAWYVLMVAACAGLANLMLWL